MEKLYKEITGTAMTPFYRPPQGIYSEENLAMAKELGYSTFFWSLAYVDWEQDAQPSREEAFEKLLGRIHPVPLCFCTIPPPQMLLSWMNSLPDGKKWVTPSAPFKVFADPKLNLMPGIFGKKAV